MAYPEHVELMRSSRRTFQAWRIINPGEVLDLTHADLEGLHLVDLRITNADFTGATLEGADLSSSLLSDCIFRKANLDKTIFRTAILKNAIFSEASLNGTEFHDADLVGSSFAKADIVNAHFSYANVADTNFRAATVYQTNFSETSLVGADFTGAIFSMNSFCGINMRFCQGLDLIEHRAASSIGVDTLYFSKGDLPESFLRGCGIPDAFIAYLPSLIGSLSPIQFYSCFISYSHKDEEFCKRLYSRLRDEKLRVWYAPEDMRGGKKLHEQVEGAIRIHDKLLLVLSEHSMESEWVKTEIRYARKREKKEGKRVLFPIRLVPFERIENWTAFDADTGKDMAVEIREFYIPDFSDWKNHDFFEKEFAKLLDSLKASTERE